MTTVRINRNSSSVPDSPTKNRPDAVLKNRAMSARASAITLTRAAEAALSRPWLSGIAANLAEVSTTEFSVSAPPAFSKRCAGQRTGSFRHARTGNGFQC